MKKQFEKLPHSVLFNPTLSPEAKFLFLIFKKYKGFGKVFMKIETAAERLNCSRNCVVKYVAELKAAGLLTYKKGGFQRANEYSPDMNPSKNYAMVSVDLMLSKKFTSTEKLILIYLKERVGIQFGYAQMSKDLGLNRITFQRFFAGDKWHPFFQRVPGVGNAKSQYIPTEKMKLLGEGGIDISEQGIDKTDTKGVDKSEQGVYTNLSTGVDKSGSPIIPSLNRPFQSDQNPIHLPPIQTLLGWNCGCGCKTEKEHLEFQEKVRLDFEKANLPKKSILSEQKEEKAKKIKVWEKSGYPFNKKRL